MKKFAIGLVISLSVLLIAAIEIGIPILMIYIIYKALNGFF